MSISIQDVRIEDFCPAESQALQHIAVTELRKHNIGVSHGMLKGEDLFQLFLCNSYYYQQFLITYNWF